jgi:probable F420-dependent oxidoreductase
MAAAFSCGHDRSVTNDTPLAVGATQAQAASTRFGILQMSPIPSASWWRDRCRQVEGLGFSSLLLSDHCDRSPVAPLPAVMAAAVHTKTLRVGTLVLNNDLRHPGVLAKELATIALLSDGRLEVGLGAGWMQDDYDQLGLALDPAPARVTRLAEAVGVLRAALVEEEFSHHGDAYRLDRLRTVPAGTGETVRILIGGGGRRVLTLAARHADIVSINWNVRAGVMGPDALSSGSPEATDEKVRWVDAARGERRPEIHMQCYLLRITDRPVEAVSTWLALLGAAGTDPEEMLACPHVLVGPIDALVERVEGLRKRWGVSYLSFYDSALDDAATLLANVPNNYLA